MMLGKSYVMLQFTDILLDFILASDSLQI